MMILNYPKTLIVRHRKENKKKCSLEPITNREDCLFLNYPQCILPPIENYVLLSFEGPPLRESDQDKGIILIDGTWKYAEIMQQVLFKDLPIQKRSLPSSLRSAYPRKQTGCSNPDQGLASIEALYAAYKVLKRDCKGLLDDYYWKEPFLAKNTDWI